MTDGTAAISRVWWHGFRQLRSPHRHHDPAIAQRLLDAAAAEPEELLKQFGTTHEGLDTQTAAQRLGTFGPNLIAREHQQNFVQELVGRAKNPLNFLLLSLAATSYFFGDTRAAAVIAVMVVLSVSLAFLQEHRSNNAAAKLRAMVRTTATVPTAAPG
jgi:P-type Mg2+ transporter